MRITVAVALAGLLLSACGDDSGGSPDSARDASAGRNTNTAPFIDGAPAAEVVYSEAYNFEPSASDPDGDPLTFEIENQPPWADFDPATGTLSGRPSSADIGVYENIVVSVSDGEVSVSLPAFSITVAASAIGTMSLNWQPPTQNEDGSPLLDLAGYVIHYGTASSDYGNEIRIENPGVTTYLVENLAPGTYYVAATSFNSDGVESDYSAEITVTVY